ncbi:retinol dehydrogenase 12-like [Photinus pyralis]|uniref:retinol dehydrogenase 12-like n=1 Tax=Photinus pyralis TaxID=7054 RepID=UPI0012673A9B|nr:retinol dehydrogenase 12-like [Photinus pyralis]
MKGLWITLGIFLSIIAIFIFIKLYLVLTTGWDRSPTCLVGKTVLVTGANTGIGFYTAQDFAKRGARVILACRDLYRGEEAKTKIVEATGNSNVVVRTVDLSSLSSVRKFAVEMKASENRLDILVNNAGTGLFEHTYTQDGLSLSMQVNHFGPFLLTILLLGLLKISSPSRIVMVSSEASRIAKLNVADLNAAPKRYFTRTVEYANTKLCNLLFANELSVKLKGTGVDVNSVHPGAVKSDFLRHISPWKQRASKVLMQFFYKSTEAGAQTSIYVAVSKDVLGVSGAYFADCKKAKMPSSATNVHLAKQLWEKCEECVKLTTEEKQILHQ